MTMTKKWITLAVFVAALSGFGELTMPTVFSSRMVLQREQPVPVWGKADPGQPVTVEFAGQKKTAEAGPDGKWRITLDPLKAESKPQIFTVYSPTERLSFSDVLVGEVWFCSGQSNMKMALLHTTNAIEAMAGADYPLIRLYNTQNSASLTPVEPISAQWTACSSQTAGKFSGVAYYFGRKLHQDLNVPVGLLLSAQSGSSIEPWIPACGFEGFASLSDIAARLNGMNHTAEVGRTGAEFRRSFPTALFNGMVCAHIPYAIRGVIWYQGESNRADGMLYLDKSKALINSWRGLWGYDFPFYFVQIAPFNDQYPPDVLPQFWEAQSEIVKRIPNTGMAVISDAATLDNIHPPDKEVPGVRLALLAEEKTYGMDVISSGPVLQTLEKLNGGLRVAFESADGLTTCDGLAPDWFEIAGEDGVFKPAQAEIRMNSVILKSPEVSNPCSVRFAWHKLAKPNLINGAGLPASAFRQQCCEN